jgi:amino acid transporter
LNSTTASAGRFGTFAGVFTPNVLTILGVIMFLRFGQVVGQSGIYHALLIVLCAKLITSLTAVSLAAISTNTRLRGGGAYYMISRSLGMEFGGAIGIVFYLAQAVSVAMYVIGFTEALQSALPGLPLSFVQTATIVNVAVFISVFIGAGWTIKMQYGILAILGLSLVSFFIGGVGSFSFATLNQNLAPNYAPGASGLTMFALFFPAVTGIMAGANMSGDLTDPGKSIPRGTFSAIGVTALIYLAMAVVLGGSRPQNVLTEDTLVVMNIAFMPSLIIAGVLAATLSSALGSMMGAPRILQALARDDVFRSLRPLSRGSGPTNEPRPAILLTLVVSQASIMLADLDTIAPIITMFFMVTYGMLNLACFYESYARNPSFRPSFRYSHWIIALAGAVGCGVAMVVISPIWAIAAILAMSAIYWRIRRLELSARWGDVHSGMAFERARRALLRLEEEAYHPKNWRPSILGLAGTTWSRHHIAEYGYWLTAGRGILTLGQVITGEINDRIEQRVSAEERLRKFIRTEELNAFAAVVVEDSLLEGVKALVQCHGIGGIRPNLVLLSWSDDPERVKVYSDILRLLRNLKRSIVIVKCDETRERWTAPEGTIDIWWNGRRDGPLMLLLAHLLVQNPDFRHRSTRLIHCVPKEQARTESSQHLTEILSQARIDATPMTVIAEDRDDAIVQISAKAAVVVRGFDPAEEGRERLFSAAHQRLMNELTTVILVHSAGDVDVTA